MFCRFFVLACEQKWIKRLLEKEVIGNRPLRGLFLNNINLIKNYPLFLNPKTIKNGKI